MIYSVTFNPALDVSGIVDHLIPNEKSYVHDEVRTPGGNGINAGIIAHRMKQKVVLTGLLGGANGEEVKKLLDKENLKHNFIKIVGKTRMNITVSNKDSHLQTRLSFPGPHIQKNERTQLEHVLNKVKPNDVVILGGSFTPSLSASYITRLIRKLRKNNVRCLVDMPGVFLKDIIKSKPSFIKPNLLEFQLLIGKKVSTIKGVLPYARKILPYVPMICISSVEQGALIITNNEVWFGKIPAVKIRSTVGAGDSMVGAIAAIWEKDKNVSPEKLLRIGLAASCATLTEKGLTLGSRQSIKKFQPQIIMRKLNI